MLRALLLLSVSSTYVVTEYDSHEVSSTLLQTLEPGVWHAIHNKNEGMIIELLKAMDEIGLRTSGIIPQIFYRRQLVVEIDYTAIYYDSRHKRFCSLDWKSKTFNYEVKDPVCSK